MTLREFLTWGAQFPNFPAARVAYWIDAAERNDGKDMYGDVMKKKL
jgi:hypothetical protein